MVGQVAFITGEQGLAVRSLVFLNLTQARQVTWEEGTSGEVLPPLDWPVGVFGGSIFLLLIDADGPGPPCHLWADRPDCRRRIADKKAREGKGG